MNTFVSIIFAASIVLGIVFLIFAAIADINSWGARFSWAFGILSGICWVTFFVILIWGVSESNKQINEALAESKKKCESAGWVWMYTGSGKSGSSYECIHIPQ